MKTEKLNDSPVLMHPFLDTYDKDEVRQASIDYLNTLLDKLALSVAARELSLNVPTLARIMDDELPLQAITYLTACYIIFMCETNVRILRILDSPPQATAYNRLANVQKREAK